MAIVIPGRIPFGRVLLQQCVILAGDDGKSIVSMVATLIPPIGLRMYISPKDSVGTPERWNRHSLLQLL